jgi:enterochelin esterase-like enzyme/sugar lactone lactonase YvrE
MRKIPVLILLAMIFAILLGAEEYTLGPDSQRQSNVPRGTVTRYSWTSKIYPGTTRDYWIYVPAEYKSETPACVMVFQDGERMADENGSFRVPIVFDNLIHKGDMPVIIGIFVNPGVLAAPAASQQNRYNRSFEYDALGDRYARFLIEEILPEVAKRYNLSKNPDDYGISGSSSGGIAAFNAAWNRPDVFRRVLSFIGSFANLRGGQDLATLIRKTEPKPLRVFLQDGSADNNVYAGNWYLGNQEVFSALQFAGYESNFVVGTEGHSGKHGGSILPDALRWLWKDYPKPVLKPTQVNERGVYTILEPGKEWELLGEGYHLTADSTTDKEGNVYFTDATHNRIYKIDLNGKIALWKENTNGAHGVMFGPDGRLYACQHNNKRMIAYSADGKESVVVDGVAMHHLAVTQHNEIYFSEAPTHSVWFVDAKGNKRVVYSGINWPRSVRLSPDQSLLVVDEPQDKWVWSFTIEADGSLANGEPFYRLETPDDSSDPDAGGMAFDTEGFLYVATTLGIEVCDQPGRVNAIINKPQGMTDGVASLIFGGPNMQWLYATDGNKMYRRQVKRQGTVPWNPVKPPMPRL